MHRSLDTNYRFELVYVKNTVVERKLRVKIAVSFQFNLHFFCETFFHQRSTSYDKKPCVSLSAASQRSRSLLSPRSPIAKTVRPRIALLTRCSVGKKEKEERERERGIKKREILLNRAKRKRLAEEIGQAHEVSVKRSLRAVREGTTIKAQARSKLSAGNYLRLPDRVPTHAFFARASCSLKKTLALQSRA